MTPRLSPPLVQYVFGCSPVECIRSVRVFLVPTLRLAAVGSSQDAVARDHRRVGGQSAAAAGGIPLGPIPATRGQATHKGGVVLKSGFPFSAKLTIRD